MKNDDGFPFSLAFLVAAALLGAFFVTAILGGVVLFVGLSPGG